MMPENDEHSLYVMVTLYMPVIISAWLSNLLVNLHARRVVPLVRGLHTLSWAAPGIYFAALCHDLQSLELITALACLGLVIGYGLLGEIINRARMAAQNLTDFRKVASLRPEEPGVPAGDQLRRPGGNTT